MDAQFDYRTFHRHRRFLKWLGFVLLLAGLFTIIDMVAVIPIPLTGYRAIFAGTVLAIFGMVFLYKGYKLPLEEALELIHNRGRGITESELVHEMLVDADTARRIVEALLRKGYVRTRAETNSHSEVVFDPVR